MTKNFARVPLDFSDLDPLTFCERSAPMAVSLVALSPKVLQQKVRVFILFHGGWISEVEYLDVLGGLVSCDCGAELHILLPSFHVDLLLSWAEFVLKGPGLACPVFDKSLQISSFAPLSFVVD